MDVIDVARALAETLNSSPEGSSGIRVSSMNHRPRARLTVRCSGMPERRNAATAGWLEAPELVSCESLPQVVVDRAEHDPLLPLVGAVQEAARAGISGSGPPIVLVVGHDPRDEPCTCCPRAEPPSLALARVGQHGAHRLPKGQRHD